MQDKSQDYAADYDEEPEGNKPSTIDSRIDDEEYIKANYTEIAEIGKSVVLKCKGDITLDSNSVYLWYNGSQIISQGNTIMLVSAQDRITFSPSDGSLKISNINIYDEAIYKCRAFPKNGRFETNIHLKVNGPPQGITIGHNVDMKENVSDETLVYRSGEKDLRFKCNVRYGRPNVKIEWIHNGNTIQESHGKDHDLKIEDSAVLMIRTLHARHAGRYECLASNEFGNIRAGFDIDVQCNAKKNNSFFFQLGELILIIFHTRCSILYEKLSLCKYRRRCRFTDSFTL